MAKAKTQVAAHRRHKKVLKTTRGYRHGRKNLFRQAKQARLKAEEHAYHDRKKKKGVFRRLWIVKINAFCRARGLKYSQFIKTLKDKKITLDRKILADLAENHPEELEKIINK